MTVSEYKKEITQIFKQNTEGGFADGSNSKQLGKDMEKLLARARKEFTKTGKYKNLFEVSFKAFEKWGKTKMDDYESTENFEYDVFKIWDEVYEAQKSDITHIQMFEKLMTGTDGSLVDYMEDDLFNYLMKRFKEPAMQEQKLAYLYQKIDLAEHETANQTMNAELVEMYRRKVLQIFSEQGTDIKFIRAYAKQMPSIQSRRLLAEIEHDYGNKEECIKIYSGLANEEIATQFFSYPINNRLKDIFKEYRYGDDYINLLSALVLLDPQNEANWMELKSNIPAKRWVEVRESLFGLFPQENTEPFRIYAMEGSIDRLMRGIELCSQKYYYLKKYAYLLESKYPERYHNVLVNVAEEMAPEANDRKAYRKIAEVLEWLTKFPEGEERAKELAQKFREAYPRKTALLKELEPFM